MRGPITLSLSGADVDAENCKGSTACQIALNRGYDELAQFPVEQGAKKRRLSRVLLRTVRTTIHIALILRCNASRKIPIRENRRCTDQ